MVCIYEGTEASTGGERTNERDLHESVASVEANTYQIPHDDDAIKARLKNRRQVSSSYVLLI
jgi:hypothetical protein